MPTLIIRQRNQVVFKGEFGFWYEPEGEKTVPKSIGVTAKSDTTSLELEFIPHSGAETVLRIWVISGGGMGHKDLSQIQS